MSEKKAYHHGDLRISLLLAAEALLAETGEVSLREVTKRAGVSPNAAYRHFSDKNALINAIAARGFRELEARFQAAMPGPTGCKFNRIGVAYVAMAVEHPALLRLMFRDRDGGFDGEPELQAAATDCFQLLVQAASEPLPKPVRRVDAVRAAVAAWALVHGYAMLMVDGAFCFLEAPGLPRPDELADMLRTGMEHYPGSDQSRLDGHQHLPTR